MISILAFSEIVQNPLKNYVSNEVYAGGNEKFSGSKDIFEKKIVARDDINQAILSAKERIHNAFPDVKLVTRKDNNWYTTFYFKDEERLQRKTVSSTVVVKSGENSYFVRAFKDGLIVRDRLSGVEEKLLIKRR
jgi:hypothetical protein